MANYTLKYANGPEGDARFDFEAYSLDAALSVAKDRARGDWAELFEEDHPICRMQLVDPSGVWRIAKFDYPD